MGNQQHWEERYRGTEPEKLTWYQAHPEQSLRWITANCKPEQALIDIGAGASTLVDHLLELGYGDITLLDLSAQSLQESRARLGSRADQLQLITADITNWLPIKEYVLWHDRAVFHFLTDATDRAAYKKSLLAGLPVGGILIMATFAISGPEKCSGLPIVQYSAESLQVELGPQFKLLETLQEQHPTPAGNSQLFNWCLFRRK
ncbi:MAG: class I SAM-dependent methyltransferase [Proteobacteria bacterium]|nr:class I SAM-dependent methyltransferase [Pseudomonadota bacterium]